MSRFPAVLPISFTLTSNSLPVTLPIKFGHESIDSAETVTAATTSAVTRYVYADASLTASASTSTSVDRYVTADDAGTYCVATDVPGSYKAAYGETSTDVTVSVGSEVLYIPSQNFSQVTITAGLASEAVVSSYLSTSIDVDSGLSSVSNIEAFVSTSIAAEANRDFDLFHVANVDDSLSVTFDLFSSLELDAVASTSLAAGPVAQSLIQSLAVANSDPLLITVARSSSGQLTAYISSISSVGFDAQSSEINTAVSNSSTTVAVQLNSVANTNVRGNATRSVTAAIVSQIQSQLVGESELHVYDVPASFLSLHQNINTSTLVEVDSVAIATKPLIVANVRADDRHASVGASARLAVYTGFEQRTGGVNAAPRTAYVAAEGDPRTTPVAALSGASRRSGSLFA